MIDIQFLFMLSYIGKFGKKTHIENFQEISFLD